MRATSTWPPRPGGCTEHRVGRPTFAVVLMSRTDSRLMLRPQASMRRRIMVAGRVARRGGSVAVALPRHPRIRSGPRVLLYSTGVPGSSVGYCAALAQSVERLTRNEKVVGSIPTGGSVVISQEIGDSPDLRLWVRAVVISGWVLWVRRWVGSPWWGRG